MSRRNLLLPLLALAALLLGWRTYRAWTEPVAAGDPPPAAGEVRPPGALAGDAPNGADVVSAVAAIAARPLFRPDRRPFRPEAAPSPAGRNHDAELSRYTMLGVVMHADDRKAVVVAKGQGRQERWDVGAGDTIPGFTVKEVSPDGITLVADGKEFLLPLYAGGPKAPAQGPPPAPGPAPNRVPLRLQPSPPSVLPPGGAAVQPGPNHPQGR